MPKRFDPARRAAMAHRRLTSEYHGILTDDVSFSQGDRALGPINGRLHVPPRGMAVVWPQPATGGSPLVSSDNQRDDQSERRAASPTDAPGRGA